MILVLGDIHGDWERLEYLKKFVNPNDTLIQVGDFGIYPNRLAKLTETFPNGFPCPVRIIDGNHENFNIISKWSKDTPTEFHKNFFYMPRGYVMEIENKLVAFMGGADSVDKAYRVTEGMYRDWFFEERIQDEDIERLLKNLNRKNPDILISHSPPNFVNLVHFGPINEASWGLPKGWIDESALRMSKIYYAVKPTSHLCGHMHRSVVHDNIRILDINEVMEIN